MSLQCRTLVLNDAKVSHNEIRAFGSEPCRLFQSALLTVFQEVIFNPVTLTLMCAGLPCLGMSAPCTQRCACPLQWCPVDGANRVFGYRHQSVGRYFPCLMSEGVPFLSFVYKQDMCNGRRVHNNLGFHFAVRTVDMFTHKCKVTLPSIEEQRHQNALRRSLLLLVAGLQEPLSSLTLFWLLIGQHGFTITIMSPPVGLAYSWQCLTACFLWFQVVRDLFKTVLFGWDFIYFKQWRKNLVCKKSPCMCGLGLKKRLGSDFHVMDSKLVWPLSTNAALAQVSVQLTAWLCRVKRSTDTAGLTFVLTCLWFRAACTEGRFSICWASRRFRALAKCCCCMVARMLTAVGCLFFSMLVKL